MSRARVPSASATSRSRFAFELFAAPSTSTRSTSLASCLTAAWRFWVA